MASSGDGEDTNLSVVLHGAQDIRLENRLVESPSEYGKQNYICTEKLVDMSKDFSPNKSRLECSIAPKSKRLCTMKLKDADAICPNIVDNAQLSSRCNGICGTDIHCWQTGNIGTGIMKLAQPIILGHEGSGIVHKIGSKVTNVAVGDRVVVEVVHGCGRCYFCKAGRYNLCMDCTMVGIVPYRDGTLTRYPIVPASNLHKLPDNVSFEEGSLMEPLACVVHGCRLAKIQLGDAVLVLGAGPIGLLSVQVAKAMGASTVGITDLIDERLELARKLGADFVVKIGEERSESALAQEIVKLMGRHCDVTLECSGVSASIRLAIQVTRRAGVVMIIGIGQSTVELPLFDATLNEIDIKGCLSARNSFPLAIELVSSGKVDVCSLISHRFSLDESLQAFKTVKNGAPGLMKCIISS